MHYLSMLGYLCLAGTVSGWIYTTYILYEHCADVLSEYVRCRYDCGCTMLCLAGTVGMYEHCADVLSEYVRCRYDCGCTMLCLAGTVSGWVGIYEHCADVLGPLCVSMSPV